MALVQWAYERRRSPGRTKALEQLGDTQRLIEHMIRLSEAHQDFETAAELRAQLRPEPSNNQVVTESAYTAPEPPKPKSRRKRKRDSPAPLVTRTH